MKRIQVVVGPGIVNKVAKHMADQSGATLAEETTKNQSYKSQAENVRMNINNNSKVNVNKVNGIKC